MAAKGFMHQISIVGVVVILLSCFSCGESPKADGPVLTQSQMVKSLIEIYLLEQKVNRMGLPRDSAERQFERFKPVIFERLNVADSVFKRSFNYYMDHPKEMELIYTAVVDSLSLMEQRIQSSSGK
jgi:hypothetical protein